MQAPLSQNCFPRFWQANMATSKRKAACNISKKTNINDTNTKVTEAKEENNNVPNKSAL